MDGWRIIGLIALVLVVVLSTMSFGAATGRLRRETRIGLQSKALRSSDAAWAGGHRAALRHLIVADIAALAIMISAIVAVEGDNLLWPWFAIPIAVLLMAAALYRGTKVADAAAQKADRRRRRPLN